MSIYAALIDERDALAARLAEAVELIGDIARNRPGDPVLAAQRFLARNADSAEAMLCPNGHQGHMLFGDGFKCLRCGATWRATPTVTPASADVSCKCGEVHGIHRFDCPAATVTEVQK